MSKYETPDYDVLEKEHAFEFREYGHFYIVEYDNRADPDVDRGFRTLFKYISSENTENEKISMTVPVIQEDAQDNRKMAFVVPQITGTVCRSRKTRTSKWNALMKDCLQSSFFQANAADQKK